MCLTFFFICKIKSKHQSLRPSFKQPHSSPEWFRQTASLFPLCLYANSSFHYFTFIFWEESHGEEGKTCFIHKHILRKLNSKSWTLEGSFTPGSTGDFVPKPGGVSPLARFTWKWVNRGVRSQQKNNISVFFMILTITIISWYPLKKRF